MRYLFTSDLHFTDRPRDAYRWEIFDFLRTQVKSRKIDAVFILGDLTDQKDHHSSKLVNRIVAELQSLDTRWWILKGNHDYVDPKLPFFSFLKDQFVVDVKTLTLGQDEFLLLPHVRNYRKSKWYQAIEPGYDFILIHQTMNHSVASQGFYLEGIPAKVFKPDRVGVAKVISGDVHVPQFISGVYYCGSPYPIHFGDDFQPRVLYWDGEELRSIKRHTIGKRVLKVTHPDQLSRFPLNSGDQVKVLLKLRRADFGSWKEYRQQVISWASKLDIDLCGVEMRERTVRNVRIEQADHNVLTIRTPKRLFLEYCSTQKVDDALMKAGLRILKAKK